MYHPNYYLENYICQEQSYFSGSSIILDIKLASLGLLIELMLLSCNSALVRTFWWTLLMTLCLTSYAILQALLSFHTCHSRTHESILFQNSRKNFPDFGIFLGIFAFFYLFCAFGKKTTRRIVPQKISPTLTQTLTLTQGGICCSQSSRGNFTGWAIFQSLWKFSILVFIPCNIPCSKKSLVQRKEPLCYYFMLLVAL